MLYSQHLVLQVQCFGLGMLKLDIRQESSRHSDVLDTVTQYLGLGSYKYAHAVTLSCKPETRLNYLTDSPLITISLYITSHGSTVSPQLQAHFDVFRTSYCIPGLMHVLHHSHNHICKAVAAISTCWLQHTMPNIPFAHYLVLQ